MAERSEIPELNEIVAALNAGKTAEPTTIRDFLGWFGAQRRTRLNVEYIEAELAKSGVRTVPGYLNRWVDSPLGFEIAHEANYSREESTGAGASANTAGDAGADVEEGIRAEADDPSFRIGNVKSATGGLTCVKPNASLQEAVTLLMSRNYSQLPVMTSEREAKGVISWKSIGARLAANITSGEARNFMDGVRELPVDSSLFAAIPIIAEHGYVLVRAPDKIYSGIVTASDIAFQFEDISKPFLLLAEIENQLRALIQRKLSREDVTRANSEEFLSPDFSGMHKLTFANCVNALSHADNWTKLNLGMDRRLFCDELAEINKIRNNVMHFNPDPPNQAAMRRLHDISNMLATLRYVGAFS